MDVQLLLAFLFSIIIPPILVMLLLFNFRAVTEYKIHFFQNKSYHKLTYFMYIALIFGIFNLILVKTNRSDLQIHMIISALLLIVFRKGITK